MVCAPPRFLRESFALLVVGGGRGGLVLASPFLFLAGVEGCLGWSTLHPSTPGPRGVLPGPAAILSLGAGAAGVGASDRPQSTPSCELALCAAGVARGRPGRGASCLCEGYPWFGSPPNPNRPSLGRAAGACRLFALGAGGAGSGPVSKPTAKPWGWQEGARGRGGVGCLRAGCRGLSTLPPGTACPWGVQQGPAIPFLWTRGAQASELVTNHTTHALASRVARYGGCRRAPGGGPPLASVLGFRGWAVVLS